MAAVICGTMLSEIAIYLSESLSSGYILISILGALEFLCSGLILKSGSFPLWLRPWATSCSVLRWIMQAGFIAVYDGDQETFPMIFQAINPEITYTQYTGYLNLFGWGGKTKWYCFGMIIINCMIFRFITLCVTAYDAFKAKGTHKKEIEF